MTIRCHRSPTKMLRVYRKFLELPSRSSYFAVRDRLLRNPGFPPRLNALLALSDWVQQGEHAQATILAARIAPDWILSPRWHFFRAVAAEALADEEQAQLARFEMAACLDGLLATGDGSKAHPFVVTYLSDVLDLLQLQRRTAVRRGVITRGESLVDVVTCDDGCKHYFCHPPWTPTRQSIRSVDRSLAPIYA